MLNIIFISYVNLRVNRLHDHIAQKTLTKFTKSFFFFRFLEHAFRQSR